MPIKTGRLIMAIQLNFIIAEISKAYTADFISVSFYCIAKLVPTQTLAIYASNN